MKKENAKVLIGSKKEAKDAARILRVMGEKIAPKEYYDLIDNKMWLFFDEAELERDWMLAFYDDKTIVDRQEITLKQLVQLLAEPAPSLLSGKCAIQVNNEREFKLLMEHYEGKGWVWNGGESAISGYMPNIQFPFVVYYENEAQWDTIEIEDDRKLVCFSDFAAEVSIKVPVFVMQSEDGVPLYEGDYAVHVTNRGHMNVWRAYEGLVTNHMLKEEHVFNSSKDKDKAFGSKEAAYCWIEEQNKPKVVDLDLFNAVKACVRKDSIKIINGSYSISIMPSDLEDMLHAHKSLQ